MSRIVFFKRVGALHLQQQCPSYSIICVQMYRDFFQPIITSQLGTVNNIIQVKKTDFEVFDALMVDSQKCSDMSGQGCFLPYTVPTADGRMDMCGNKFIFMFVSDLSSSPPGPYHQDAYVHKQEEKFKSPPILPPHLLQVILNKDTGISVSSCTIHLKYTLCISLILTFKTFPIQCDPALLPEPNHVMLNHLYALSIKVSQWIRMGYRLF